MMAVALSVLPSKQFPLEKNDRKINVLSNWNILIHKTKLESKYKFIVEKKYSGEFIFKNKYTVDNYLWKK